MARRTIATALALTLACAPVVAPQAQSSGSQGGISNQTIGRLLGAGVGALLGSQVGGGKGKLAAVAVGALAGFWLGGEVGKRLTSSDQAGIARTTQTALDTGQNQTWRNPDTGVSTQVAVKDSTVVRQPLQTAGLKARLWESPPLEPINAFYVATQASNVRGGPGADYVIMDRVNQGQRVAVVGKVQGSDWVMIADGGYGTGFVYGPLLSRDARQPVDGDAIRAAAAAPAAGAPAVAERKCALVVQKVTLPDGKTESHDVRACQRPDGTWETV